MIIRIFKYRNKEFLGAKVGKSCEKEVYKMYFFSGKNHFSTLFY